MVLFVVRTPSVISVALLLMASGSSGWSRWSGVCHRLQDRIIRLEMRLRLTASAEQDITRLSRVSHRPPLCLRRGTDDAHRSRACENLTGDQIKRAVTHWQADRRERRATRGLKPPRYSCRCSAGFYPASTARTGVPFVRTAASRCARSPILQAPGLQLRRTPWQSPPTPSVAVVITLAHAERHTRRTRISRFATCATIWAVTTSTC